MKILKYIIGIVAVLVIAFFLIGQFQPEVTYDCEIMVDKPLAEAWAVAQDPDKMSEWLPGFQKIEHVSGTPNTVGAVSNVYFENNGENMVIQETITSITPNESVSMTFTSDFMDMDYSLSVMTVDGQTKIMSSTIAKGNGAFSKSIMASMSGTLKTQEDTNLANLKNAIENNTKDYFPEPVEPVDMTEEEPVEESEEE